MFWEKGIKINPSYKTGRTFYKTTLNTLDKQNYLHPCCKPTDILTNFILNSSNEGDLILDPFAGSCSTLISAKRLKRNYIGFEIDKKWFDTGSDRLQGINANGEMNLFDIPND